MKSDLLSQKAHSNDNFSVQPNPNLTNYQFFALYQMKLLVKTEDRKSEKAKKKTF